MVAGLEITAPTISPSKAATEAASTVVMTTGMSAAAARARVMLRLESCSASSSRTTPPFFAAFAFWRAIIWVASATAVASSRRDAPAIGRPVRSSTMVWKFSRASRRPWEISGWYGV